MSATGNIAARLAALEQQVASLRGQVGGGEALSPNYLTVNAQGQVDAVFSGGIQIPELIEASGSAPPPNAVTFTRALDPTGAPPGQLYAYEDLGAQDVLGLLAKAVAPSTLSVLNLAAINNLGSGGQCQLTLEADKNPGTVSSNARLALGQSSALLLDDTGRSNFLQLLSTQKLQLAFGAADVTWPGGSPYSNGLTLNTGLGRPVETAAVLANSVGVGSFDVFQYANPDNNGNLFLQGVTTGTTGNPGAGVNGFFLWIAIG